MSITMVKDPVLQVSHMTCLNSIGKKEKSTSDLTYIYVVSS